MKKCPFCAEEIQDEAIKCKHCGTMLNQPVSAPAAASPVPATPLALMAGKPAAGDHPDDPKRLVYQGSPSWRAYFGSYALIFIFTPLVAALALWVASSYLQAQTWVSAVALLVPLATGAVALFILGLVRKSDRVRVSNRSIEHESGVFSKKIDVVELWRIRDVRYKQSFLDRILGIAHIEVFTKDVTTPHFEIVGLPASRELFEKVRDNIEIQRQSHRVMGIID